MTGTSISATVLGLALLSLSAGSCRRVEPRPAEPTIAWRSLGAWSGRGNMQTESFTSDTGSMQVQWTTAKPSKAGAGEFRLTIHSAISGRPLMEAVDQQGAGKGTAFVHEDPRVFFAVVDSADLDWSFTLEEALFVESKRP
jgi:hypothetical protein